MKINIDLLKEFSEDFKSGKFNSKIDLVNKIIRIIIQTSSAFTLLSILITFFNIFYHNFEIQNFKIQEAIGIIAVYGAFYLTIFTIFPIIGLLTLIHLLNKVYDIEITKINIHFRQLTLNIVLMILAILLIAYLNYRLPI